MAFFDDIGKKLSQAGQTAVQKTKDMADITRINGAISDEEKRVNNNYYQIGKLYVALHANDYESDFEGMISAIIDSESKIKEYHQQIQDIKGVVRCEKCGAEVANNVPYCSACGSPMPKQQPTVSVDMVRCSGCGNYVNKGMRFCTSCGKPMVDLTAPRPAAEEPQPTAEEPQPTHEAPQTIQCPTCGMQHSQDTVFCTGCGTKLN